VVGGDNSLGVSRNTLIRSSMYPSTLLSSRSGVGMTTDIGLAWAIGIPGDRRMGLGTWGCAGLCNFSGSQSWQRIISLARSVTNSENMHHVGGLGAPPNVRRR
jgi:hypothetical protein